MLGDHLHPARMPERDIYSDLAAIYSDLMKLEDKTVGAKFISEIAVLTNDRYLSDRYLGLAKILGELKYSFDILNTDRDFSAYPLVIMPDNIKVDETLAEKLRKYLLKGGKIISTGHSGLNMAGDAFALPELGFLYVGENRSDKSYFRLSSEIKTVADMDFSVNRPAIKFKAKDSSKILAAEVAGYRESSAWDGLHWYRYVPPKAPTGNCAVAINGEGNAAHIAFSCFEEYFEYSSPVIRDIVGALISRLLPCPNIKPLGLPKTSRAYLCSSGEGKLLFIKASYADKRGSFGVIEDPNELLPGKKIAVLGEYESAVRLADSLALKTELQNGYTYITLPEIVGCAIFYLE